MPKSCSAFNCKNRYSSKTPEITFHRFPFSKPLILKEWLKNIGREDFHPRKHMVICSFHFTPECFSGFGNRKNLLWNAVPTVFETSQNAKQKTFRRMIKRMLASAEGDSNALSGVSPFIKDSKYEGMLDIRDCNTEEAGCQSIKALPTDHTYALLDTCTTKDRLFKVLDINKRLQRKLQFKTREINRMKLKLKNTERKLTNLQRKFRYRCFHHNGNAYL